MEDPIGNDSESMGLGDAITDAYEKRRRLLRKYALARYQELSIKKKCEIAIARGESSVFVKLGCIDANTFGEFEENEYTVLCEMIEEEGPFARLKLCNLEINAHGWRCDTFHSKVGTPSTNQNKPRIYYCGIQIEF